nr:hypothetical protein [Tanacetum cinerariifolium]
MYPRRTRIAQSSVLSTIADEPTYSLRDVSQGEACPTDSGFIADQDRATIDKSFTLPCDSSPRVTSLVADEGKLTAKFQAQEVEIHRLKERVKMLEDREGVTATRFGDDAPIKGRSMDEREAATERIGDDSEEMATVLTSMDAATVLASGVVDVPSGSGSIPTASTPAEEQVTTGSDVVPTASPVFATANVIDAQVARELEEQLERDDQRRSEQIARDAKIARIHAEEELQIMIDGLDRTNETMEDFIPMGSKEEAERIKRKGLNLEQESAKKQKTSEEVPEETMSFEEVPKEKVYTEGQRSYWKITRLEGSSASYQFFIDLLKHLDREDLNQLWRLVKETLSNKPPTKWKIYDSCGVHHVTSKDKEIFMLVENDYPLRKGLALVMISYKLQVENYLQMANDLILKIYKIHLFHDEWVSETYLPKSVEGVEPAEEVNGGDERVVTKRLSNSFVDWMVSQGIQISNGQLMHT